MNEEFRGNTIKDQTFWLVLLLDFAGLKCGINKPNILYTESIPGRDISLFYTREFLTTFAFFIAV